MNKTTDDHTTDIATMLKGESARVDQTVAAMLKDGWRPLYLWSAPAQEGDEITSFLNQTWIRRQA